MPALKCTKEIKQFSGLTGYYRKFVPRFADISTPLTSLTKKETVFNWTPECQKSFDLLKSYLCGEPILKYADTSKPYTLYTDTSKYGWVGVLTQSHTTVIDDQAEILLRSDHLPLKKFLQKNTLNSKVNNWAMELESFNIQFEYIQGSKNVLVDTLSRFIDIDQDTQLPPEEQGYEFGYAILEELPPIKCYEINDVIAGDKEIKNDLDQADALQCIDNPVSAECLQRLQEQDPDIQKLKHKLEHNRLDKEYYKMEDGLLKRKVVDGGHEFLSIYLPASLVLQVLRAAHDDLGHNGFPRTYAAVKQIFY